VLTASLTAHADTARLGLLSGLYGRYLDCGGLCDLLCYYREWDKLMPCVWPSRYSEHEFRISCFRNKVLLLGNTFVHIFIVFYATYYLQIVHVLQDQCPGQAQRLTAQLYWGVQLEITQCRASNVGQRKPTVS